MSRIFLVPKVPLKGLRPGTAPKYWQDLGFHGAYIDAGDFYLVRTNEQTSGKIEDQLAAMPDVQEVEDSPRQLSVFEKAAAAGFYQGKIAVTDKSTGAELITELRAAIKVKQTLEGYAPEERAELLTRMQAQLDIEG